MREILFRGKRVDDGKWVEGNLFISDLPTAPTQILIGTNAVRINYDVIPETVGQCTGLVDKNGKKIFEGDIVKYEFPFATGERTYEVYYDDDRRGFYPFACGDGCGCCENETESPNRGEVVGNIHDNPELLEVHNG